MNMNDKVKIPVPNISKIPYAYKALFVFIVTMWVGAATFNVVPDWAKFATVVTMIAISITCLVGAIIEHDIDL